MAQPRPGAPVRGSTSGRALMAALDLLGRRWALRICWELRRGARGPRALLECCPGLSSSVLYARLGELAEAGVLVRCSDGTYELTDLGAQLGTALGPLDRWALRWAATTAAAADGGIPSAGPACEGG